MANLTGKVALITGAARGQGSAERRRRAGLMEHRALEHPVIEGDRILAGPRVAIHSQERATRELGLSPLRLSLRAASLEPGAQHVASALLGDRAGRLGHVAARADERAIRRDLHVERRQPPGIVDGLPFGVDERGRYLIEQSSFTYLTSGSDLLQLDSRRASREPALVMASPAFGELRSRARPASTPAVGRAAEGDLSAVDPSKMRFPPLAETAVEGKLIQYFFPGTRVLIGAQATEAALKKVHGPRVLHLATHGFFLPAPAGDEAPGSFSLSDPGLRSGLALAGANERESEGGEDGILTARELATGVDLLGTKLVVLSACETGVGDLARGEGVYSLRRAFVEAGAETQVMSLWQVDDGATQALMSGYYRRMFQEGKGRSAALREQQLAMLADEAHAHPYYWASFIVSGDPSPLTSPGGSVPGVAPSARGCGCELASLPAGEPYTLGLVLALCLARRRKSAKSASPKSA